MARRFVSRGFSARRQGPRRATTWGSSVDKTAVTNLAAATTVLHESFSDATLATVVPATIVRTVGSFWCKSDQVAAERTPIGALGMAVVSEQARVAGVASVPSPTADSDSDLFFQFLHWTCGFNFVTAAGVLGTEEWARFDFDSRAMRKVVDGDAIVMVVSNSATAGGIDFVLQFRMLFKLH